MTHDAPRSRERADRDPAWVRWSLVAIALATLGLLVAVPVVAVFVGAFAGGASAYWRSITHDPDTLAAIGLTLTVVPVSVAANVVFGVAAAWAIARFRFPGRSLLVALIDLPFAVSPVVAGLMFVLVFGRQGLVGPVLGTKIIFATPGIVLVTTFVTLPFVARELIPVMEATGADEELAALSLGASGWRMFVDVTLPNVKWGLVYGIILCNARAMGEFGAVHVASGRIAGKTDTMPLRIEKLFQEYDLAGSFAVASLLTLLAIVTLVVKSRLERKMTRR
jgi:sulfate transport system permease protein